MECKQSVGVEDITYEFEERGKGMQHQRVEREIVQETQSHQAMLKLIVWDTFSAIPHIQWVYFSIPDIAENPVAQGCILTQLALATPPVSHSLSQGSSAASVWITC